MKYAKRILRRAYNTVLLKMAKGKIAQIDNTAPASKTIVDVLHATLNNNTSLEEKAWIDKIESLRKELNASPSEIQIVDYGAGKPNLKLTGDQMYQGRIVTMTVGDVCRSSSKSPFWGFLLFRLIRAYTPMVCLELGTSLGISGCYQATALKINQCGLLKTLEGADALAHIAAQNFQTLGLDNIQVVLGRFQDTLPQILNQNPSIDYAFIDGHHDEQATLDYFNQIKPFLSKRSILVFDDIEWSRGMKRAWHAIQFDSLIKISIDLSSIGICILDGALKNRHSYKIPLG